MVYCERFMPSIVCDSNAQISARTLFSLHAPVVTHVRTGTPPAIARKQPSNADQVRSTRGPCDCRGTFGRGAAVSGRRPCRPGNRTSPRRNPSSRRSVRCVFGSAWRGVIAVGAEARIRSAGSSGGVTAAHALTMCASKVSRTSRSRTADVPGQFLPPGFR